MEHKKCIEPQTILLEQTLRTIIPAAFFNRAAHIVNEHRPQNQPPGFDVYMQLSPEDEAILNQSYHTKKMNTRAVEEMKQKYFNDPVALKKIAKYDPNSPFRKYTEELRKAYNARDQKKIDELLQQRSSFED